MNKKAYRTKIYYGQFSRIKLSVFLGGKKANNSSHDELFALRYLVFN